MRRGHATGVFLWPKVTWIILFVGELFCWCCCCPGGFHVGITPKRFVSYKWCSGQGPKKGAFGGFCRLRVRAWWIISSCRSSRTSGFVASADACPGSGCLSSVCWQSSDQEIIFQLPATSGLHGRLLAGVMLLTFQISRRLLLCRLWNAMKKWRVFYLATEAYFRRCRQGLTEGAFWV